MAIVLTFLSSFFFKSNLFAPDSIFQIFNSLQTLSPCRGMSNVSLQ